MYWKTTKQIGTVLIVLKSFFLFSTLNDNELLLTIKGKKLTLQTQKRQNDPNRLIGDVSDALNASDLINA